MRVLVVEDELKISGFITRGLREELYIVDNAYNGEEGLSLAMSIPFDIILLDIMMPKMDGLRMLKKLRENGILVSVILLTVKNSVQDKVNGLDAGADDYLIKPFAFEELLARMRALLRARENKMLTCLKVADLEIDIVKRKVTRDGKEIELTSKEFVLLEYLFMNKGAVVTRTMISEHIWDINFDSFTNVIDVHINNLRNKVDRNYSKKLIHTIRGRGYVLKD
jgi:heavy metal response regulator